MKIEKVLVAAFLSLMTSASYAVTVGSRSNVTVALTSSYSVGGFLVNGELTDSKDTVKGVVTTTDVSTKIKIEKVTNKELLMAMKEADLLDGTIVGWSIVLIDGFYSNGFYAIKKGLSALAVPLEVDYNSGYAYASTSKYTYNEETFKETFTESGSGKFLVNVSSDLFMVNLQGVGTINDKTVKGKLGTQEYGGDNPNSAYYLGGASKLSGLSGKFDDGAGGNLIEGSISISAASVVDLVLIGVTLVFSEQPFSAE